MGTRHLLSEKDEAAKTATCSVCGPTAIRPNGPGKWICSNKKLQTNRDWKLAHPEKASPLSAHHLTEVDEGSRRGTCPIDGEVAITAAGRGWLCGVRAVQMGRKVDLTALPSQRCEVCGYWGRRDNPVTDKRCQLHPRTLTLGVARRKTEPATDEERWVSENRDRVSHVNLAKYEEKAAKVPRQRAKVLGAPVPAEEWKHWNELLAREGL